MRNLLAILFFSILTSAINAQIITIPDTNFKAALLNHIPIIDTNGDGQIQIVEANQFPDTLNVSFNNIHDLTGLEYFNNISGLDCQHNQLISLNIDSNLLLRELDCSVNQINSLNVSQNVLLTKLWCGSNPLGNLDISTNNALKNLHCGGTNLTSLNVQNNTLLTYLTCSGNQLDSIDISNSTLLTHFYCRNNAFSELDLSNNTLLVDLDCEECQLASLNLTNNPLLKYLSCENNQLDSLNVSMNTSITHLNCSWNQLNNLDVSGINALISLYCRFNQLTSLDVSKNSNLQSLNVGYNQLKNLNVNNNNNTHFYYFYALINPELICIEVDDANWATTNWDNIDSGASFSENCSFSIPENSNTLDANLFPNPFNEKLQIKFEKFSIYQITIVDLFGKEVLSNTVSGSQFSISTISIPSGTYILQMRSLDGIGIEKLIKL